jgi:hypothetical protein
MLAKPTSRRPAPSSTPGGQGPLDMRLSSSVKSPIAPPYRRLGGSSTGLETPPAPVEALIRYWPGPHPRVSINDHSRLAVSSFGSRPRAWPRMTKSTAPFRSCSLPQSRARGRS